MNSILRLVVVTGLLATGPSALADHLMVTKVWARATPPGAEVGAAYFQVDLHGGEHDELLGVSAPVGNKAELHTHVMEEGLMKMRKLESVPVHPGESMVFQPGGHHVMLMGLKAPLKEGDHFPMTLTFKNAGAVEVEVHVTHMGAMHEGHSEGHSHEGNMQMDTGSSDHSHGTGHSHGSSATQ